MPLYNPDGGTAGSGSSSSEVGAFFPGVMEDAGVLLAVPMVRASTFAADFAGSYGNALANATAQTILVVKKNGVQVGTITFAAGVAAPTFATSGGAAVEFAINDILSVHAPAVADATLADVGVSFLRT